ncbi:Ankyrin repeat domain containing protein [Pandoravirus neocaledonia]|uniref:Ankyrin repeat domain containing protein n=1 Tax=Pandoravirus neocaledonia TaxID=2107708 RepID=A0A2U7UDQ3_9VIRU|nr:Ankyrin repeat domain containing protein [Pandoravirus neocaledonia]AVK76598.1 Ankyrin repeat domain containing protein [Pandoravirus neocaledonia]
MDSTGTRNLAPEVVGLILDKLDAGDADNALKSGAFAVDADAEGTRRRCRTTKKRHLVSNGDLAALKRIRKKRSARFVFQDVTLAARGGHLDAVVWLCKHARGGYPRRVIQEAAAGGHLAVVKWLCESGCIAIRPGAIDAAMDAAAKQGHADVIDYLATSRDGKGTPVGLFWAVRNGHADTVRRLCAICPENAGAYYYVAYKGRAIPADMVLDGDLDTTNGVAIDVAARDHDSGAFGLFDLACFMGRTNIVEWLWKQGLGKWTQHLYHMAANPRGTGMVDFLYARRSSLEAGIAPDQFRDESVVATAALGGSVARVAAWHFGMSMPVVLSRSDVAAVAARGHLDMIKFLHTKGAPVHPHTCLLEACEGGSVEVVAYMIDAGAAIDKQAVENAVRHGHSDIVRLLYARGGGIKVDKWVLYHAVRHCDAGAVMLLRKIGRAPVKSRTIIRPVLRGRPDIWPPSAIAR